MLISPKPGEGCSGSQFPGERLLSARPAEGLREMLLHSGLIDRVALCQQIAFDSQQLGKGSEPFGNLPSTPQSICQLAKEPRKAGLEAGLRGLVERATEKPQSIGEIALPDHQGAVKAIAPTSPARQAAF